MVEARTKPPYKVAFGGDVRLLEEAVAAYMAAGYQPSGGVFHAAGYAGNGTQTGLCQPMILK